MRLWFIMCLCLVSIWFVAHALSRCRFTVRRATSGYSLVIVLVIVIVGNSQYNNNSAIAIAVASTSTSTSTSTSLVLDQY